jgi:hypothetical protein
VLQVLPSLLSALNDPESEVRGAAGFALGQFSEYLQPDITYHHAAILPAVFGLLQDPDTDVQERACYGELNIKPKAGTCTRICTCSSADMQHNVNLIATCRTAGPTVCMRLILVL